MIVGKEDRFNVDRLQLVQKSVASFGTCFVKGVFLWCVGRVSPRLATLHRAARDCVAPSIYLCPGSVSG